jgi:predicted nucleic acid binding AN1-type Zn finger protein
MTVRSEGALETMSVRTNAFHAPLHPLDSEKQTYACRHTNPNVCAKHSLPGVCAFVRKNNICLSPPNTWKKQFQKLFFQHLGKQTQKRRK